MIKNDELVNLRGGYDNCCDEYSCKCGFTGGYTSSCYNIKKESLEAALQWAASICNGAGATCWGGFNNCENTEL